MLEGPGIDVLSDADELLRADQADLLLALARAGAQVRSVADRTAGLALHPPRALLVAGPGAGRDTALLTALGAASSAPIVAVDTAGADDPVLPAFVGALDLVVVLAGDRDDPVAAELIARARHRAATVVVRAASVGPVADAAGSALISPVVGVPELLAGPGRIALLLRVAAAAGFLPAVDADQLAAELDAESLACGPAAAEFTNPATDIAQRLWGAAAVLVGSEPVGTAIAGAGASGLGLLGGIPAAALSAAAVLRAPQLVARLGSPSDPFADPFADPVQDAPARTVPVLIAPVPGPGGTGQGHRGGVGDAGSALHRGLERTLPGALVITEDGAAGSGAEQSPFTRRVGAAMRTMLRLDYAAVYLGIAGGQLPPIDAPTGLGPAGSAPPSARPATVDGMSGDGGGSARDPWGGAAWN